MSRIPVPPSVVEGLQRAVDHLNAGRYEEATHEARQVLAQRPDDASALNVMGVVALQRGDYDAAIPLFRRALRTQPGNPFIHFNLAEAHRRSRVHGLAVAHFEKAAQLKPDFAEAHAHRGEALRAKSRLAEAASAYRTALDLQPGLATALNGLGRLLQVTGAPEEAARHYEAAMGAPLVGEPGSIATLFANAGLMRLQRGAAVEGFTALMEAVLRAPEEPDMWRLLARSLRHTKVVPADPAFRDVLQNLLQRDDVGPTALATAAAAVLKSDPGVAAALEKARRATDEGTPLDVADPRLQRLLGDHLLRSLLVRTPIPDVDLELLLTGLRRALLLAAAEGDFALHQAHGADLVAALAEQCFLNEYIYYQAADEEAALARLRVRISHLGFSAVEDWLALATVACFVPICELKLSDDLLTVAPAWAAPLLGQQLEEPKREAEILADLSADVASAAPARAEGSQEEPAFPRWTRTFAGAPRPFREVLQDVLPHLGARELPSIRAPRIMILGCRTGLPIMAALGAYEGASVLGVDANLNNLAYARRKLMEANHPDVELMQATISDLPDVGPQFDLVEAPFVFYRRADTETALTSVTKLLKPGGFIRFSLYSEAARKAVSRIHAIVVLAETGGGAADLRALRRDLTLNPITSEMDVIKSPASDFWASSPCGELLFRQDERRFDLPEIGRLLDGQRLDFLGLELGNARDRALFAAEHPSPDACVDIEAWRHFEQDHPEIFGSGYQVWARKKLGRR